MAGFAQITLSDKATFDKFFREYPPQVSELTFTNLFCWRHSKKYLFDIIDSHLVVSYEEKGARKFLQPVGPDPVAIIRKVLQQNPGSSFERVDRQVAQQIAGAVVDRDQFDYVYSVEHMQKLEGGNYVPKRNFIKRAQQHNPTVCELDGDTVKQFFELQEKWCDLRNCREDNELHAEDVAVREALENFKALGFIGVCIWINNNIEAFAIGEPLNNDTFVEHFEKANPEFMGLYQLVLNEFSKKIPAKYKFLNREQDLGIEGLRKAKESYHPVKMVEKCRITA